MPESSRETFWIECDRTPMAANTRVVTIERTGARLSLRGSLRAGLLLSLALAGCSEAPRGGAGDAVGKSMQSPAQPAADLVTAPRTERELSAPITAPAEPIPHYSSYVLSMPEVPGVVPWKKLAQVQVTPAPAATPQFDAEIAKLDAQEVKLQGFMLPLEAGEKHKRFILAALPPSCGFCLPGGPESVVEVLAREPIKFTLEPIVVSGKFSVLKNDPLGLFYRLSAAKQAAPG